MVIRVNCPSCGKQLKVRDSSAGKTGKCPDCGSRVKIPDAVYDAEEVSDKYETEETYGFENMDASKLNDYGSPALPDRRPCPMCGEMIVSSAAKCRYCGEIFDETLKRKAQKRERSSGGFGSDDDNLTTGDWIFCALCGGIACIVGIVYMIQGKPKGIKMVGVAIMFNVIWAVVRVAIEGLGQN